MSETTHAEPKSRPISFKDPLVRAILAGTKTQTRRICRQAHNGESWAGKVYPDGSGSGWISWWPGVGIDAETTARVYPDGGWRCPYGDIGDRLWMKEALRDTGDGLVNYSADDSYPVDADGDPYPWKWKPRRLGAMYCPRWASRIDLEITEVRVQRLQDITEEDARAEGVKFDPEVNGWECDADGEMVAPTARGAFACLWDSINAERPGCAWADSPWVWCISFKRVRP